MHLFQGSICLVHCVLGGCLGAIKSTQPQKPPVSSWSFEWKQVPPKSRRCSLRYSKTRFVDFEYVEVTPFSGKDISSAVGEKTDDAGVCSCGNCIIYKAYKSITDNLENFAYTHVVEVPKELLLAWNACESIPWNMSPHIWIHFGGSIWIWNLTYPIPRHFSRWFSFSNGGICDRSLQYSTSLQDIWVSLAKADALETLISGGGVQVILSLQGFSGMERQGQTFKANEGWSPFEHSACVNHVTHSLYSIQVWFKGNSTFGLFASICHPVESM